MKKYGGTATSTLGGETSCTTRSRHHRQIRKAAGFSPGSPLELRPLIGPRRANKASRQPNRPTSVATMSKPNSSTIKSASGAEHLVSTTTPLSDCAYGKLKQTLIGL